MSAWLTIVVGLGAGAASAIITTWGGQSRERRQARADARDALRLAEQAIHASETAIETGDGSTTPAPGILEVRQALDDLETRAMLANLPRGLVHLYHEATLAHLSSLALEQREAPGTSKSELWGTTGMAAFHVASTATELLSAATWHPWLSAPWRLWRTRQLSDILAATDPTRPPSFDRRRREKEIINDAIQARDAARDAARDEAAG